jgi:hypothetical protein
VSGVDDRSRAARVEWRRVADDDRAFDGQGGLAVRMQDLRGRTGDVDDDRLPRAGVRQLLLEGAVDELPDVSVRVGRVRLDVASAADAGFAGIGRSGSDRKTIVAKSSCSAKSNGLRDGVEAAGIEPRSQQLASDSEEDADLASADAGDTASEAAHKQAGPDGRPLIDPGQLTVFDFLDGTDDGGARLWQGHLDQAAELRPPLVQGCLPALGTRSAACRSAKPSASTSGLLLLTDVTLPGTPEHERHRKRLALPWPDASRDRVEPKALYKANQRSKIECGG